MTGRRPPIDPDSLGVRLGSRSAVDSARRRPKSPRRKAPASAGTGARRPARKTGAAGARRGRSSAGGSRVSGALRRWFVGGILGRVRALEALPPRVRIALVGVGLSLFAVALVARAAQLQLRDGQRFRDRALGQGRVERTIAGSRGRILDRHGVELASTLDAPVVFARREDVGDRAATVRVLSRLTGVSKARLGQRLRGERGFVYLDRRASPREAEAVRAAALPGVSVAHEPRRFYGNARLAAHVLGFVDIDGVGRSGIERALEARLRGGSTSVETVADALRRAVFPDGLDAASPRGRDVVLTLDRHVQFVAEEALEETVVEHRAKSGVAIVLDARTSEILALASHPTFNPNDLSGSTVSDRTNRALAAIYDPGSTAKIVTVAAALDAGVARPDTPVDCEDGAWRLGGRTIRDASHRFGVLSVSDVFKRSSNIGAGKLGLELGPRRLHDYLRRFGFGQKSGIELPGELPGLLRPADRWRPVDTANIAFGQGVSATPLQIAMAANVIAAGGWWRPPRIVRRLDPGPEGRGEADVPSIGDPSPEPRAVVSPATAEALTWMMSQVTQEGGTAPRAAIPGFDVAGKTGTAQIYDPELRAYSRSRYVASFVGFVPAERPAVTVLVLIEEPRGTIYGGAVAGPAFRTIAEAALASKELYAAAPAVPASTVRVDPEPEGRSEDPDAALARAVTETQAAEVLGEGARPHDPVEARLSAAARALLSGAPLPVKNGEPPRSTGEARRMPDLRGRSIADALEICAGLGLDPDVQGRGRVVRQRPRAGARLGEETRCTLELGRDG